MLEHEMYFSLMVWARRLYRVHDSLNIDEYLPSFKTKLLEYFNIAMDMLGYKITRTHSLLLRQPFEPKMWFRHLKFESCSVEYPVWVIPNYVPGCGPVDAAELDAYNFEADHFYVLKYHT